MRKLYAIIATAGIVAAFGVISTIETLTAGAAGGPPNRITWSCGFTNGMMRQVDPIVSPGVFPSAHQHDFCGDNDIDQNSGSGPDRFPPAVGHENDPYYHMRPGANSTDFTYGMHENTWNPEAFLNGVRLVPYLWFLTLQSPAGSQVEPMPGGMTSVVGDAHATAPEDNHVTFNCGSLDGPQYPKPVDCTNVPGGVVTAQVVFPDCWDGTTAFDTPAGIGMSHFAYSTNGICPSGMVPCADGSTKTGVPFKMIAQLITRETFRDPANPNVQLRNPNDAQGNLALTLSSGQYFTEHADLMWTASREISGNMVDACLNHGHLACASKIGGIDIIGFTTGPGLT